MVASRSTSPEKKNDVMESINMAPPSLKRKRSHDSAAHDAPLENVVSAKETRRQTENVKVAAAGPDLDREEIYDRPGQLPRFRWFIQGGRKARLPLGSRNVND